MSAAVDFSYHKVGATAKGHRVWIENLMLERNGFTAGAKYLRSIEQNQKVITLKLVENDSDKIGQVCTVSKASTGTPIIDLCNKTITTVFGDHDRVLVEYSQGTLIISLHHVCKLSDERVKRFRANLARGTLDEGTFCFGIGMSTLGIHEGFKKHGVNVNTKWVLDREPKFINAALRNNPVLTSGTSIVCGKMEEVESRLFSPVDIFQFSMSCRVHSKASRAKQKRVVAEDHADAAGVYGIFKALEPVNPSIIVSENVKEAKDSATYVILKSVLVELGYNVYEFILNSEQSGSFENRPRYWFVAIDKNLPEIVPESIPHYARQFHTFEELETAAPANEHEWRTPSEVRIEKVARDKAKGNGFSDQEMLYPESTRAPVLRAEYAKSGSTDVRVAGKGGTYRMLTPHEHCLMKQAPFSLIDGLNKTLAHYVLGQGVDMGQSIGLAELICMCLLGKVKAVTPSQVVEQPKQALLF